MDLMEYKARELFEAAGLPVKKGVTSDTVDGLVSALDGSSIEFPLVCKAQVQIGGRGKAGGIKVAKDVNELREVAGQILGMDIRGHIVKKLMAVEMAEVATEMYLSIMLDRLTKCPLIIFSPCGGMDIEETSRTNPEMIFKVPVNPVDGINAEITADLAAKAGLSGDTAKQFEEALVKLYDFFMKGDCMLAEINPIVVDKSGNIIALDGKVSVDDSAVYRQPEVAAFKEEMAKDELHYIKEARDIKMLYIPIDEEGTIAVASNGSGMLMSCMDRIADKGMKVGVGMDLGGGPTHDRIKLAVHLLLSNPKIKGLFMNIFGGITRCDEVAEGIRLAKEEFGIDKLIVVRFEGTNKDKGLEILSNIPNVVYADGLIQGVDALVERREQL